jgi:hypothetical protein
MRLQRCVDPSRGRPAPYNEFVWAKQKHLALHEYAAEARATPAGQRPSPPPASGSARPSASPARSAIGHPWLREKIEEIRTANHAQVDEVIGGKLLATAWQEIEDPEEKAAVLSEIRSMWEQKGWWDDPPGRGKRKVKAIYACIEPSHST